jgi:hypothetical protein
VLCIILAVALRPGALMFGTVHVLAVPMQARCPVSAGEGKGLRCKDGSRCNCPH